MYDVVIVGGGPAGLSAALMLGRACRRVVVVDAGQPRNAAAAAIHGFLGRDGTNPHDLLRDGRKELRQYQIEIINDVVIRAEYDSPNVPGRDTTSFRVQTEGGRNISGRKLLFCTGMKDEIPELPGIEECYGASVHHCPYCDGWEHRDKALIAYGHDPGKAVGLALSLRSWSPRVTAVTGGQSLTHDDRQSAERHDIKIYEERIVQLVHHGKQLKAVVLEHSGNIPADALFFNTSHRSSCKLIESLGCHVGHSSEPQTSDRQQTSIPGLFVAGDADGDVQFVIVAAAEGATAAVAINRELQDEDRGNQP